MNYLKAIIVYLVIVFILHVIPTSVGDGEGLGLSSITFLFIRADYLLHLLLFIPMMVLVWLYLDKEKITGITRFNHILLWLVAGITFAAFVEALQCILPYRSYNPKDMLFNIAGVITGALVFLKEPKRYARLK